MNCPNCGLELKENEKNCPVCQTTGEVNRNDKFEEYKENEKLNQKYGFNKLLIFSILEICCCNQIFGIVGVLLLFLKLKPSIAERNFEEADKWERTIRLILIIGLILGIFAGVFQLILNLLPAIIELIALV